VSVLLNTLEMNKLRLGVGKPAVGADFPTWGGSALRWESALRVYVNR